MKIIGQVKFDSHKVKKPAECHSGLGRGSKSKLKPVQTRKRTLPWLTLPWPNCPGKHYLEQKLQVLEQDVHMQMIFFRYKCAQTVSSTTQQRNWLLLPVCPAYAMPETAQGHGDHPPVRGNDFFPVSSFAEPIVTGQHPFSATGELISKT